MKNVSQNYFNIFLALIVFSSPSFAEDLNFGVEFGKNYSNKIIITRGDPYLNVHRTFVSVSYLFSKSTSYSIGIEISTAADDNIIGSVSSTTYGDILSTISFIQEYKLNLKSIQPIITFGTGIYSAYYCKRDPGTILDAYSVSSASWADGNIAVSNKVFTLSNIDYFLKLKIENIFSYFLVYNTFCPLPVTISLGAKF